MSDIEIDVNAVESAHSAMLSVVETIGAQSAQHNRMTMSLEGMLSNAASTVFTTMNHMHGLDPYHIWERWGFGSVAHSSASTHGAIENAHGTTRQIVNHVSDAHRGQLAPILLDRASGLQSSLGNALNSLGVITSLLNPGNILWLMGSPWSILEHFSNTRNALNWARAEAQEYADYLARLAAREQGLIAEITESLRASSTYVAGSSGATIYDSPLVKDVAHFVDNANTIAGEIPQLSAAWARRLAIVGFIADVVEGGKYDPRTISVDANAAVVGYGIGVTPVAGEVYGGLAVGSIIMSGAGWGIQMQANQYQGTSRAQLDHLSSEWTTVGKAIDPSPLTHDLGQLASDLEGENFELHTIGIIKSPVGEGSNLGHDLLDTGKNTVKMLWGVGNLGVVRVDTALVEGAIAARAAHAPAWLQTPLDWSVGPGNPVIDNLAHVLTW